MGILLNYKAKRYTTVTNKFWSTVHSFLLKAVIYFNSEEHD